MMATIETVELVVVHSPLANKTWSRMDIWAIWTYRQMLLINQILIRKH